MSRHHPAHADYHRSLFNSVCHAPVVPLVAVAAGYATAAALPGLVLGTQAAALAGATWWSAAAGFVVSTGINAIGSRALASSPSASPRSVQAARGQAIMVRSSVESHKIVYGRTKVSGPMLYAATTDSGPIPHAGPATGTNVMLHLVIALAGHEIDAVETVYLNDEPLTLNASGYATNLPYAYYPTGTASTKTISTAVRTGDVVTVTTSASHGFTAGDQVDISVTSDPSMNGSFIIASTPTGTTFTYANGGPNSSATGGSATDNTLSSTENSYVRVKTHLGNEGQEADTDMIAELPGWTTAHRLQGIAYLYVRMQYNVDVFSHGIPNISAVIRGKKVYDPRDASTAWSDNAALCTRDYMSSDYGFNCDDDELNDTYFSAAANICDESVSLSNSASQSRYTINGVIDTASTPLENLNKMTAAMVGTITYVQGQFRCYAGAYDAPVGSIDLDTIPGSIKIRTRPTRGDVFNRVQGTHINPFKLYQLTDFPAVTNSTYEAQDGDEIIANDIILTLTNHPEAAQRLGKVILEQGRQGIQVNLPMMHHALQYAVWDTITFTNAPVGWSGKVFRIKKISTADIAPFNLTLQEESSASYDWDSGDATTNDPAPDTNLPDPFTVSVVGGLAYTSRAVATPAGDSVYNLVATWTLHPDIFVQQGGRIEIQYKLSTETDWRASFFVQGDLTAADIPSSSVNVAYDIRVRAVSVLGSTIRSNWSYLYNCMIGTSGGVTSTEDWGDWTSSPGSTEDWGDFTTSPGATADWGFYT